jgi:hypothetical protein
MNRCTRCEVDYPADAEGLGRGDGRDHRRPRRRGSENGGVKRARLFRE